MSRPGLLALLALLVLAEPRARAGGEAFEDRIAGRVRAGLWAEAAADLRLRLADAPGDPRAWTLYGRVETLRCDLAAARAAYERALERDPFDPEAWAGLAEVLLLEGRTEEALGQAATGLASPRGPRCASLWRVRGLCLLETGRHDLALASAERAVALAPGDARATEAHARIAFRLGDMATAGAAYRRAVDLDPDAEEANLRLGSGFGPRAEERPWATPNDAALWAEALSAWDAGDLDTAGASFRRLAEGAPEAFKYRLGLGLVRAAERRRREVILGGDPSALYLRLPAPPLPGLERFVRGLSTIGRVERHVVLVSVAPARRWWDALLASGATHEMLPLSASLPDALGRSHLEAQRTFDGRHYAHLRGVGGREAATGTEKLREAAAFGFNTFAHEFAHQLHRFALPPSLQETIDALYRSAVREGRCLDWYAASNADEYFAQGYEAMVSLAKRGCLKETQRHTRRELAERDPALFAFLGEQLDFAHEGDALEDFRRGRAEAGVPP
jgi:tetratricopeptide (TPR) repeat protein